MGFEEPVNKDKIRMNILIRQMEEMANAPKEEFGKRQPGELCAYEKQNISRSVEEARNPEIHELGDSDSGVQGTTKEES